MRFLAIPMLLAAPAAAQSFNVDIGLNAAPSSAYGGAAGQTGTWNEVDGVALVAPVPLVDLDGAPTGVTIASNATTNIGATYCFLEPGGDEGALMGDAFFQVDFVQQHRDIELNLSGLQPGWYQVYTYSWNPCNATSSAVGVAGSPDHRMPCGDYDWPGHQRYRRTFVRHRKEVTDGTLTVIAKSQHAQPFLFDPAVNGLQLVFQGSEPILGRTTCWLAEPNSSGQSATLDLVGNPIALFDNVELRARALPVHAPLVFLVAPAGTAVPAPAGTGTLCLAGPISVIGSVLDSGPAGAANLHVAISQPDSNPAITIAAGETWHFQTWFRDPSAGWTGNLSDAVAVTFE
jgi:hypothetical protein